MLETGQTPVVSIISLTYNHAPYIRECLEGFLMQKTDFPFEVIIHDDASTDGTTDIVREYAAKYPDIIKPIIQTENQYSKHHDFNKILKGCLDKSLGKYIAFCEGDDYWIDPLKLQKQVDFLESHPDYGMVHTNFKKIDEKTKKISSNGSSAYDIVNGDIFLHLFQGCFIRTLTVLCRKKYIENLPNLGEGIFSGDLFLFFEISLQSKSYYINEETSMYRLLPNSASHILNPDKQYYNYKSLEALDFYYIDREKINPKIEYLVKKKWFIIYLKHHIRNGEYIRIRELKNKGYISFSKEPILYIFYTGGKNKIISFILKNIWKLKKTVRH